MTREVRRYIYTAKRAETGEIICMGTSEEVARHLGVTSQTIAFWTRSGCVNKGGLVVTRKLENRFEDVSTHKKQTLCWRCGNTNRFQCSWFDRPAKPVDGWKAEQTVIYAQCGSGERVPTESFIVKECPNFVLDERVAEFEEQRRAETARRKEESYKRKLQRDRIRYQQEKEKRENENKT